LGLASMGFPRGDSAAAVVKWAALNMLSKMREVVNFSTTSLVRFNVLESASSSPRFGMGARPP